MTRANHHKIPIPLNFGELAALSETERNDVLRGIFRNIIKAEDSNISCSARWRSYKQKVDITTDSNFVDHKFTRHIIELLEVTACKSIDEFLEKGRKLEEELQQSGPAR